MNHGLWSVAVLSCQDLFKSYLKMDPGDMTKHMSIIHLPWSIKLLYGLISDNVPICGTRRKAYIIIMGVLQFVALMTAYGLHNQSAIGVAFCLCMASLSEAFVNTVCEAMMCIQARKDPVHGSQDLIAFSWLATGFGGLIGSFVAGIITQYYHPKYGFFLYSFFGLIVAFNGFFLTKQSEEEEEEDQRLSVSRQSHRNRDQANSFWDKLKENMAQIWLALLMPEILMVVSYFLLSGVLNPDFGDFSYYFMMNVCKISKF